jgi:soluble lytic murein transglycosylase-like protein
MTRIIKNVIVLAITALLAASTLPCRAADSAVLRNGFSIRHERREIIGTITRLYTNADEANFVDIPTTEIDHFESALPDPSKDIANAHATLNVTSPIDLNQVVTQASGTYRLDPDLVNSVIRAESGFNTHAISPKGAQGLMQLMPQTASQLGVQNAFDPQANVEAGTRYLRELLERYNFDLIKALAAYNAGPQRVEQYGGVPPYYETRAYVARIVRDFNKKKIAARNAAQPAAQKIAAPKNGAPTRAAAPKPKVSSAQTQAKLTAETPKAFN